MITWPEITPVFFQTHGFSKTFLRRYWAKVSKNGPIPSACPELGPCWLWQAYIANTGYGQINKGSRGSGLESSHVAAWMIAYGEIPEGMFICHRCDVKACCNPRHLWLGSNADNIRDMWSKGRAIVLRGEDRPSAKFTWEQIRTIRTRYADGETIADLARAYNRDRGGMSRIVHNKIWRVEDSVAA